MIADLQSSVEEENRKRKNAESSLEAARDEVIFWPKFEDSFWKLALAFGVNFYF